MKWKQKQVQADRELQNELTQHFKGPVHILQYEKLKNNMTVELKQLADFLKVNVTDHDIYCTVKQQEGNFHRNTSYENHIKLLKQLYSTEKLLTIRETVIKAEHLLKDAYNFLDKQWEIGQK